MLENMRVVKCLDAKFRIFSHTILSGNSVPEHKKEK